MLTRGVIFLWSQKEFSGGCLLYFLASPWFDCDCDNGVSPLAQVGLFSGAFRGGKARRTFAHLSFASRGQPVRSADVTYWWLCRTCRTLLPQIFDRAVRHGCL